MNVVGENGFLSIAYPIKFHYYFYYSIEKNTLSNKLFDKTRASSLTDFKEQIKKWSEQGLAFEIRRQFDHINKFKNKEDFEKIIKAIFFFANFKPPESWRPLLYIGFKEENLTSKLYDGQNEISTKYYKEHGGKIAYHDFISRIFAEAKEPYYFESKFLAYCLKYEEDRFILTPAEIELLVVGYLRKYCELVYEIDYNVWMLYANCKVYDSTQSIVNTRTYLPRQSLESNIVIKNFISTRAMDSFIVSIVKINPDNHLIYIDSILKQIFGNEQEFKKFIMKENSGNWEYLEEFKSFLVKWEKSNFGEVEFHFNKTPVKMLVQ